MRVRFLKRAQRQLEVVLEWLHEHGGLSAFRTALRRKLQAISATPHIGAPMMDSRTPGVRVAYLETKHVLYSRVNEELGTIEVLRVWHTSRGHRPRV